MVAMTYPPEVPTSATPQKPEVQPLKIVPNRAKSCQNVTYVEQFDAFSSKTNLFSNARVSCVPTK
jgi:hypothetical protein